MRIILNEWSNQQTKMFGALTSISMHVNTYPAFIESTDFNVSNKIKHNYIYLLYLVTI